MTGVGARADVGPASWEVPAAAVLAWLAAAALLLPVGRGVAAVLDGGGWVWPTDGAALARMGELGMRLDSARLSLGQTINSARSAALARETERRAARRDQESAERLEQAAVRTAEETAERRLRTIGRRRARSQDGDQE